MKKRRKVAPREALQSWRALLAAMHNMSESDLLAALKVEAAREEKRRSLIERLHRKYNMLRYKREREELLQ
jgi:hypothetical protein